VGGNAISFAKDGKRCLTTGDLILSLQAVKASHGQHHQIEEFIKSARSVAVGQSPARHQAHIYIRA
jgi:hypothetical protein